MTEDGVTEQFDIPDEQPARLLFWVERDTGQDGDSGYNDYHNKEEKDTENVIKDTRVTFLDQVSYINLTYFVAVFQYPTLHLTISERSQWLSAHFYHDVRVFKWSAFFHNSSWLLSFFCVSFSFVVQGLSGQGQSSFFPLSLNLLDSLDSHHQMLSDIP